MSSTKKLTEDEQLQQDFDALRNRFIDWRRRIKTRIRAESGLPPPTREECDPRLTRDELKTMIRPEGLGAGGTWEVEEDEHGVLVAVLPGKKGALGKKNKDLEKLRTTVMGNKGRKVNGVQMRGDAKGKERHVPDAKDAKGSKRDMSDDEDEEDGRAGAFKSKKRKLSLGAHKVITATTGDDEDVGNKVDTGMRNTSTSNEVDQEEEWEGFEDTPTDSRARTPVEKDDQHLVEQERQELPIRSASYLDEVLAERKRKKRKKKKNKTMAPEPVNPT